MFCLFKNAHIHPRLNRYVSLVGWVGALAWLYFAFIEKALVYKLFQGEAILVDLLLGVPLVLMMAVVVYATLYWLLKLLIVYVWPQAMVPVEHKQSDILDDDPTVQAELEQEFGEQYWDADAQHQHRQDFASRDSDRQSESTDENQPKNASRTQQDRNF
jgi:hypothetical protein